MPINKFRFVSPGVKVAEIDNSQLPDTPADVGPVIIGRANRGPGLRAVQVDSMSDFVEIFGNPVPGNSGRDPWRDGPDVVSPAYGTYAAEAYLRNSTPITYVRLLGKAHTNAGTTQAEGAAGWKIGSAPTTGGAGGGIGLFLLPSGSGTTQLTGTLAAVFYCVTGTVEVAGKSISEAGGTAVSGANIVVQSDSNGNIRANIIGAGAGKATSAEQGLTGSDGDRSILFNFNRTSKNFIRRAFNTNPTLTNTETSVGGTAKTYFLGESFESMVDKYISTDTFYAYTAPLISSSATQNEHLRSTSNARTGWTFAQNFGATGSFQPQNQQKLFRFVTHNAGAWEAQNLKISISDIRGPTNQFDEYGTFTVQVRLARDIDEAPQIVEQFTMCNLDPNSSNFIARKIGDQYVEFDDTKREYRTYGGYAANSKYIRVEMNSAVETAKTNAAFLPFGFYGPVRWKGYSFFSGSYLKSRLAGGADDLEGRQGTENWSGFVPSTGSEKSFRYFPQSTSSFAWTDASKISASVFFPSVTIRDSSSQGSLNSNQDAYFGSSTSRPNDFSRYDESYQDLVRAFPSNISQQDGASNSVSIPSNNGATTNDGGLEYSYLFTLDDICLTGTSGHGSGTIAVWLSGSHQGNNSDGGSAAFSTGSSMTATGSNGYKTVLDNGFDKFTMPLIGGSDGLNIQEAEPFNNTRALASGKTELTSYAMNSVKMAVDVVADPEDVQMNMISMPGITSTPAQDHMISTCENRADALAIIDLAGDYTPPAEGLSNQTEADRKGDVDTTISNLESRALNTSYAAAYYPFVQIRDRDSGRNIFVPPSVVALGTLSSAQAKSDVWFAPAGFTRGGLSEGAAGIPVTGVKQRLRSKDRDDLYAANINPIAQFPAEGIVIFGQKTLQVTPSALDRINVRRLLILVKRQVSFIASRLLFEQNVQSTWDRFTGQVAPFLDGIVAGQGLMDYRIILDETTTTPDLIDRNILYAKIYLKPARAIEFIAIDFIITRTGASFED
tara:strand:- start:3361 stop:6381 length:3021 start_codon:yes stop_codon:yes gene_type:complete